MPVVRIRCGPLVLVAEMDLDGALRVLREREDRLRNLKPLLRRLATLARKGIRQSFKEAGPGWAPLAPSTIAEKRMLGFPRRTKTGRIPWRLKQNGAFGPGNILIRRGDLRDSWSVKGAPGHVEVIDEQTGSITIGSSIKYAKYHQGGTKPYTIVPRLARALLFTGRSGEPVIRRIVHHPGLPARPVRIGEEAFGEMVKEAQGYLQGEEISGEID